MPDAATLREIARERYERIARAYEETTGMPIAARKRPATATKPREAPLTLTIPGAPRTKKNSGKIWKVGKRTVIKPSAAWLAWRDSALAAYHSLTFIALTEPVNCAALFYRDANRGDATGYYQGLADVLEELGVVENDRLITQWDGSRLLVDRVNPRVVVTLTPVEEYRAA